MIWRHFLRFWTLVLHIHVVFALFHFMDQIKEDMTFYHKRLSAYPSKSATIEFSTVSIYKGLHEPSAKFDIYTLRENETFVPTNCTDRAFGQLRNENLHRNLKNGTYRFMPCVYINDNTQLHCTGIVQIQDYIPRKYQFSFGFECGANMTLKGLKFNITVHSQSNETKCIEIPKEYECSKFYSKTSLPNLIGDITLSSNINWLDLITVLPIELNNFCYNYQFASELICLILMPKCDAEQNHIIHPCKETCEEFHEACFVQDISFVQSLVDLAKTLRLKDLSLEADKFDYFYNIHNFHNFSDCDYLPSKDADIPCVYESVTCSAPPFIKNAATVKTELRKTMQNESSNNTTFPLHSVVEYSCANATFEMNGNKTITCLYSGRWSEPPTCVSKENNPIKRESPLFIVLPLTVPLIAFAAYCIILQFRKKRLKKQKAIKRQKNQKYLRRNRAFDAFVCFSFDSDNEFVFNTVLPKLEEQNFKLFTHDRDFEPGLEISTNVENAVENSNSAIIIMSQHFIDSIYCKLEFQQCILEREKDPAFRLLVVMRQPADTLVNMPEYMRTHFAEITYLEERDRRLFRKIGEHLTWIKQPKLNEDVPDENACLMNGTAKESIETDDNKETNDNTMEMNDVKHKVVENHEEMETLVEVHAF